MQEEGKKSDLLKNDFDTFDISSFKIKKKKKIVDPNEGLKKKGNTASMDFRNENFKYLKVDEMNVIKVRIALDSLKLTGLGVQRHY